MICVCSYIMGVINIGVYSKQVNFAMLSLTSSSSTLSIYISWLTSASKHISLAVKWTCRWCRDCQRRRKERGSLDVKPGFKHTHKHIISHIRASKINWHHTFLTITINILLKYLWCTTSVWYSSDCQMEVANTWVWEVNHLITLSEQDLVAIAKLDSTCYIMRSYGAIKILPLWKFKFQKLQKVNQLTLSSTHLASIPQDRLWSIVVCASAWRLRAFLGVFIWSLINMAGRTFLLNASMAATVIVWKKNEKQYN